jgi:hypothetical protein
MREPLTETGAAMADLNAALRNAPLEPTADEVEALRIMRGYVKRVEADAREARDREELAAFAELLRTTDRKTVDIETVLSVTAIRAAVERGADQ